MQRSGSNHASGDARQLAGIGVAGGLFSGLFGVGGGTVMVPLLVVWRGFNEKLATGTSLMAIVVVACFAATASAIFGDIDVVKGVLIGIPAVGGVIAGTALQQRLSNRVLSGLFAILALTIAALYVTGVI
ncbi:MAG: sulfite exporter TauE/SafE family protein [Actinobacteria bacterium]|nr:sulfite exporter TauE/SafE family protein [Actinomycetota bacterium]